VSVTGGAPAAQWLTGTHGDIPLVISREAARRAAQRELSKRMYHEHDPNLFQRAINHVLDWIGELLDSAAGVAPGGTVGLTVIILVILALVVALWWRLGSPRRAYTSSAAGALFEDGPRTAADHRAAAETHAAAERWNEAVQERMRAIVRALEERALLDPRPGRTALEAATEAGQPLPAHANRLRGAAADFDDITYGGRDTGPSTYRRLYELDTDLEHTRPEPSAASRGSATAGSPQA
jgi:hypothetical protein